MKKVILLLGLFSLLFLPSQASNQDQTASDGNEAAIMKIAAARKVLSIHPCAFKPAYSSQYQNGDFETSFTKATFKDSGAYDPAMYAPVFLPDGAVVKDTYAVIIDDDGSYYLYMNLIRRDVKESIASYMSTLSTSGMASSWRQKVLHDSTISNSQIDNYFTYFIEVNFGFGNGSSDLHVLGFWIIYE